MRKTQPQFTEPMFRTGDELYVTYGEYFGKVGTVQTVFEGYVTRVGREVPASYDLGLGKSIPETNLCFNIPQAIKQATRHISHVPGSTAITIKGIFKTV